MKRDAQATIAADFKDPRSYVRGDGGLKLYGKDMELQRENVYRRDGGRCMLIASPRCRGFASWNDGEMDHIVGRGKRGSDDLGNLRWTCKPCHRFRHIHPKWGEKKEQAHRDFEELYKEKK